MQIIFCNCYNIMAKKIALLLSGNVRTFFYNDFYIANTFSDLVNKQDIDVFIYTENNDFNYNNIQYLSENNKEKILGNPDIPETNKRKYSNNIKIITYEDCCKILKISFLKIFGEKLKNICIDDFNKDLINNIYDKTNINHNVFMNTDSAFARKNCIMCQFYKLYKCYNLMVNYENANNFNYDIVIRSRFDGILNNINKYDIRSFDLTKRVYCEGYKKYINDWWAIGDRFIMDKYCNYYLNISPNLVDGVYLDNVSDSSEFGLTYLIRHKNNYETFYNHGININLTLKFYK